MFKWDVSNSPEIIERFDYHETFTMWEVPTIASFPDLDYFAIPSPLDVDEHFLEIRHWDDFSIKEKIKLPNHPRQKDSSGCKYSRKSSRRWINFLQVSPYRNYLMIAQGFNDFYLLDLKTKKLIIFDNFWGDYLRTFTMDPLGKYHIAIESDQDCYGQVFRANDFLSADFEHIAEFTGGFRDHYGASEFSPDGRFFAYSQLCGSVNFSCRELKRDGLDKVTDWLNEDETDSSNSPMPLIWQNKIECQKPHYPASPSPSDLAWLDSEYLLYGTDKTLQIARAMDGEVIWNHTIDSVIKKFTVDKERQRIIAATSDGIRIIEF